MKNIFIALLVFSSFCFAGYGNGNNSVPIGNNGHYVNVNHDTTALEIIDAVHEEVHRGNFYNISRFNSALSNGASTWYLIYVPANTEMHITLGASTQGNSNFYFYENVLCTSSGSAQEIKNMNRESANTASVIVYNTAVNVDTGTIRLNVDFVGGGKGLQAVGGSYRSNTEWILNGPKLYSVVIWNVSGGTSDTVINLQWYEFVEP